MEQKWWVRSYHSYLRLIMWHVLNKRLIWKLLRTIGNVLCGISWRGGYNWRAGRWGWVHHGALMMLVLPLLGHIWYCRKRQLCIKKQPFCGMNAWTWSMRRYRIWSSCLPLQSYVIRPLLLPQPLWVVFPYTCYPWAPNTDSPLLALIILFLQEPAWKQLP